MAAAAAAAAVATAVARGQRGVRVCDGACAYLLRQGGGGVFVGATRHGVVS